jgi:hypothetical protein
VAAVAALEVVSSGEDEVGTFVIEVFRTNFFVEGLGLMVFR